MQAINNRKMNWTNKIVSKMQTLLFFTGFFMALLACKKEAGNAAGGPVTPATDTVPALATVKSWLVDKNATEQTAALFYGLKKTAKTNILFGHQDATKRGYGWANEEGQPYQPLKSDVKEVTGVYPAVYGWDFNFVAGNETGAWFNYENTKLQELVTGAYNRGGVNTFAWHYQNPVSGGSFYWNSSPVPAVNKIIPGGTHHAVFKNDLKKIAVFAKSLIGADGKLVPLIFRPFHEFDGDWFWWGKAHCTADEYKTLYQFTVSYLRDSLNVRNFLYAWSPDRNFTSQTTLLERFPGNAFVDVVGTDNYEDLKSGVPVMVASGKLKLISDYAKANNKIAALTETGLNKVSQTDWYTTTLLKVLTAQKLELSYVLVWANRNDSYWTPYVGHPAAQDFILFKNNGYVLFGDQLPKLYQLK